MPALQGPKGQWSLEAAVKRLVLEKISICWTAPSHLPSKAQAAAFQRELGEAILAEQPTSADLEAAWVWLRSEHEYPTWPTINEVIRAVRQAKADRRAGEPKPLAIAPVPAIRRERELWERFCELANSPAGQSLLDDGLATILFDKIKKEGLSYLLTRENIEELQAIAAQNEEIMEAALAETHGVYHDVLARLRDEIAARAENLAARAREWAGGHQGSGEVKKATGDKI